MKPGEKNIQYNKTNNTQLRGWQNRLLPLEISLSTSASPRLTRNFSVTICSTTLSAMCYLYSVIIIVIFHVTSVGNIFNLIKIQNYRSLTSLLTIFSSETKCFLCSNTECKFNKYQYGLFHIWNECLKQDWCTFFSTFFS